MVIIRLLNNLKRYQNQNLNKIVYIILLCVNISYVFNKKGDIMSVETSTLEKVKISLPKKFKVILKDNGDGTLIVGKGDFIKQILLVVFNVDPKQAIRMIKKLDNDKSIIIGVFSKQIAETMVSSANAYCNEPHNKRFDIEAKMEQE